MLYAVGIVELELESTSAFVLLLFVVPLAFTLSGFLLWILYSLNGENTGFLTLEFAIVHLWYSNNCATNRTKAALQAADVHVAI